MKILEKKSATVERKIEICDVDLNNQHHIKKIFDVVQKAQSLDCANSGRFCGSAWYHRTEICIIDPILGSEIHGSVYVECNNGNYVLQGAFVGGIGYSGGECYIYNSIGLTTKDVAGSENNLINFFYQTSGGSYNLRVEPGVGQEMLDEIHQHHREYMFCCTKKEIFNCLSEMVEKEGFTVKEEDLFGMTVTE